MASFIIVGILFICYLLYGRTLKHKVSDLKTTSEAVSPPKPVTPPPVQHPYQKQIDKHSSAMIKEIEMSMAKGIDSAEIWSWQESYQKQLKREVLLKIRKHFEPYKDTLDFKFTESKHCLRVKIVLIEK